MGGDAEDGARIYLMGGVAEDGARISLVVPSDGTRGNGHK